MKNAFLILSALFLMPLSTRAQMMSEAETKAMNDYGTPGPMHAILARDTGTWDEEMTLWMEPGAPPVKASLTAVCSMTMAGRYQLQTHTGTLMMTPFSGLSTSGYDNARSVFVNTWIDNFGTGIMVSEGRWNEATRSIEFKGLVTDPMAPGGKQVPFRQILYFVDANTQRLEMFMTHEGKEYKSMETRLKRRG